MAKRHDRPPEIGGGAFGSVVIHHVGGSEVTTCAAAVKGVQSDHMARDGSGGTTDQKMSDIGYHGAICPDGSYLMGRSLQYCAGGATGHNGSCFSAESKSRLRSCQVGEVERLDQPPLHLLVVGNFASSDEISQCGATGGNTPSAEQLATLAKVIAIAAKVNGGAIPIDDKHVPGHRHLKHKVGENVHFNHGGPCKTKDADGVTGTVCPGENLVANLPEVRQAAAKVFTASSPAANGQFADVANCAHKDAIKWLQDHRTNGQQVIVGCDTASPPNFCPGRPLRVGESNAMFAKYYGQQPPAAETGDSANIKPADFIRQLVLRVTTASTAQEFTNLLAGNCSEPCGSPPETDELTRAQAVCLMKHELTKAATAPVK